MRLPCLYGVGISPMLSRQNERPMKTQAQQKLKRPRHLHNTRFGAEPSRLWRDHVKLRV